MGNNLYTVVDGFMVIVYLTPDQSVWAQVQARDILLCSWARNFTLAVTLSTKVQMYDCTCIYTCMLPGGSRKYFLLVTSCY